jgi:hypothetical protein
MYRTLNLAYVVSTLQKLANRIRERFPDSNLNRICQELLNIAGECESRVQSLRRPHWPLRCGVAIVLVLLLAVIAAVAVQAEVPLRIGVWELLQGLEAAVNEIILMALAVFFLFSLEIRLKRRESLRALHELRSIAHVIDMHQLTKDPEAAIFPSLTTPSSPQRNLNRFELARYLDYCAEMLALTSKLAAYHAQYLRDPVILDAVNDVETLTGSLSHKIWQKITILDDDRQLAEPSRSPDPLP